MEENTKIAPITSFLEFYSPKEIVPYFTQIGDDGEVNDTELTSEAASINDDVDVRNRKGYRTRAEKEKALIALFKRHGLTLSFEGAYEDEIYE